MAPHARWMATGIPFLVLAMGIETFGMTHRARADDDSLQSSAYEDGLQAWEGWASWVSKLPSDSPEGVDYREGVEFWAKVRNDPNPPPCTGNHPAAFISGCQAAAQKLALIDARRKSEPDFWRGWNRWPRQQSSTAASPAETPEGQSETANIERPSRNSKSSSSHRSISTSQ